MWFEDKVAGKWEPAIKHLSKDKVMRGIIKEVGPCTLRPRRDYFVKLVQSILSQQVSTKAATSMYKKLTAQFTGKKLNPTDLAHFMQHAEEEVIRSVGFSRQKRAYVLDLAQRFESGEIPHKRFGKMSDEEIVQSLIQIKGIGRWTVEMLLIFALNRTDVWPVDDLAIRESVRRNYGFDERPTPKQLRDFADRWKPYRTIASWYLWRSPKLHAPAPKPEAPSSKPRSRVR